MNRLEEFLGYHTNPRVISIKGLDKAAVFAALFNSTRKPVGGIFSFAPKPMTKEEAQELLNSGQNYFDVVRNRRMMISFAGDTDTIDVSTYDAYNHTPTVESPAQNAIDELRKGWYKKFISKLLKR